MARRFPLPSYLSTKRSKAVTVAAAGTLTLAAAVSAATLTLTASSSAAPLPSSSNAAFAREIGPEAAQAKGTEQVTLLDNVRSLHDQRHAQQAAAAKVTAAKAAAARQAAAAKAAKAAAAKAAQQAAAAKQAAAARQAAAQRAAAAAPSGSPEQIAEQMLSQYGWSQGQFSCLQPLWFHESGWNPSAENPSSGAYGIPQALPAAQMASAGADWRTNPATQIRWGLSYIQDRYGSPCGAWSHEESDGWY